MNEYKMRYNTIDLSRCPICERAFREGQPVHLEHLRNDNMTYIFCQSCWMKQVIESASEQSGKLSNSNEIEDEVKDDEKLWRYMDLSKFVSMLKSKSLHFSSPKLFVDKFEGAIGDIDNKNKWDDFYLSSFRASMYTAPDNCWHNVNVRKIEEESERLVESLKKQKGIFINCWHSNPLESEAMWNLYARNVENALAIQTTGKALREQLEGVANVARVKYIDYGEQFANINNIYEYKRKSFEHEREVRAIYRKLDLCEKDYIEIPVDIAKMIDNIYVSPYAPEWFIEIVVDLLKRYGLSIEVKKSGMCKDPF